VEIEKTIARRSPHKSASIARFKICNNMISYSRDQVVQRISRNFNII
jgi:hypothetical protein